MERALAIFATLVVGALIAFQPPVNSQLAKHMTLLSAAFVSTLISALVLGLLMVAAGEAGNVPRVRNVSWIYLTGGLMGAALVSVSLLTVRTLGAGGVVAATVCSQVIVSALLDRAGVLGLDQLGLTPLRLLGFGLLLLGTFLVVLR